MALIPFDINKYKASGYTGLLLVNSILKIILHLQMLYASGGISPKQELKCGKNSK